jgi:hypothetical protein
MNKEFMVTKADGTKMAARQLATFAHYIENVQFRFVVTQLPGELPAVTHRASGLKLTGLQVGEIMAARNDHKVAGSVAVDRIVKQHGGARVASKLREQEVKAP